MTLSPGWITRGPTAGCVIARRIRHFDNRETKMNLTKLAATSAVVGLMGTAAFAQNCGPEGQSIRILANDFPAIQAVAGTAEENCSGAAGNSCATTPPKRATS
jgi:hypothetical protein